ncbi:alkaline shock response membrane anchor protein AmaP [Streptomyces sp. 7-21]|jgi:hypothetical protein|uniref:alkaline shock response membrane anchor protein AmaP n=1 Tax=Streptomyces sp. 7-21 TaxID=2802283 RepID=UPI00191DF6A0|nr:alkaline shock response membrane anchor protein AmaP [Streptomyces sp. 7-21]MBL1069148.1 alkaline shock response membrane anchor protein AmaP [Streptomyces sp. 7-21]
MPRIANRLLIGLIGLALVGFGLAALAAALDLPQRWGIGLPSWWSWREPGDVPLTRADRTQWRDESWWWPAVLGTLSLLVVLPLWWLLAQTRRKRLSELPVGGDAAVQVRGSALEEVLAAEAEALPGVDRARVTLVGRRHQPRLRIGLLLTPQADPARTLVRLREETIEHARRSAGLAALPAEVRFASAGHATERLS